jgi:hypothetical protein
VLAIARQRPINNNNEVVFSVGSMPFSMQSMLAVTSCNNRRAIGCYVFYWEPISQ